MPALLQLLLALVMVAGFCLLLVVGAIATWLLVLYLHGLGDMYGSVELLPTPKQSQIFFWCLALIFLVSFSVFYLSPSGRLYVAMGAVAALIGAFIYTAFYAIRWSQLIHGQSKQEMFDPSNYSDAPYQPNSDSKTTALCDCNWFNSVMAFPNSPIQFDTDMNEYHFIYADGSRLNLYHCLFCGGAAPRSKRSQLFLRPSKQEMERLEKLTDPLNTVEEILAKLGLPEKDHTSLEPISVRYLTYTNLSETTDVQFQISELGAIEVSFSGKYIGPPISSEDN